MTIKTFVLGTIAVAFGIGCTQESTNSDLQKCKEGCAKTYEECGDAYIEDMAYNGVSVSEEDLANLLEECEAECDADNEDAAAYQSYENCILNALEGECVGLARNYLRKIDVYYNCLFDCQLGLDCDDFFGGDDALCESECVTEYDQMTAASDEFGASCGNEWEYAYSECEYLLPGDGEDECAPGCPDDWLGDGFCDDECNNADCNYDDGDCDDYGECSPGCPDSWLGDGICDDACNNLECYYDYGDCY